MRTLGAGDDELAALSFGVADGVGTGAAAAERLLAPAAATAFVCASDSLALGALSTARSLPAAASGAQPAVVGFDDTPVARAVGLSSVAQPLTEAAGRAFGLLLDQVGERLGRSDEHADQGAAQPEPHGARVQRAPPTPTLTTRPHLSPAPAPPQAPPAVEGDTPCADPHAPHRSPPCSPSGRSPSRRAAAARASRRSRRPRAAARRRSRWRPLTILIGSSGDAETDAVNAAVAAWSEESGVDATVNTATDLVQELAQGFAAGSPPDLFYASWDQFAGYAANGSLLPYGDQTAAADDFFPSLRENFTLDDEFYCAPKDFSTLALVINTDAWAAAGLTDADIPTDWESLASAATTLTTGTQVGLSFGPEFQRLGVFMEQAGGGLVNDDGTEAIADSPENVEAVEFVKQMLADGVLAYPSAIDSGWGGEALGTGRAAMVIEGNWIVGAMKNDFPDLKYTVVPLPEGPAGPGTFQFTNCWGIAADSANQDAALELVDFLTSTEQQIEFANAFGVMPSVQSAAEDFRAAFPEQSAFLDSADFAVGPPSMQGASDVIADFNGQIEGLASADVPGMLASVQTNMQAVLDANG